MNRIVAIWVLLIGCGGSVSHFARVELPYRNPGLTLLTESNMGVPVAGEDCSATIIGIQLAATSARVAIAHAIGDSVRSLNDVSVSEVNRGAWIVGERCIRVEGRLP